MNPLILAGAASAISLAKDFFTGKLSTPTAAKANAGQSAQAAATQFDQVLQTQTALNAQKARVELEANLAKPMSAEAQSVALNAFAVRQENIAERLQKGIDTGQVTAEEAQAVRDMQAATQSRIDTAMSDGVLTVGEFKQVYAGFEAVSRQVASYRFNQQMGSPRAGGPSFSATV